MLHAMIYTLSINNGQSIMFYMPLNGGYIRIKDETKSNLYLKLIYDNETAITSTPEQFESDCRAWYAKQI